VSLFYKDFTIRSRRSHGRDQDPDLGERLDCSNQGFELELRRGLGAWADVPEAFTMVLNYLTSTRGVDSARGVQTNSSRRWSASRPRRQPGPGVGAARGIGLRLLCNYTGRRSQPSAPGSGRAREPRGTVDLAYTQRFDLAGIDWTVKASAENLTDEPWEFTQADQPWTYFSPGVKLGLSLGLTFF
jgi:hypothetical protein